MDSRPAAELVAVDTHPDGKYRIGNITRSPYAPGMAAGERHAQRLARALEDMPIIRAWCEQRNIEFWTTTNDSGHAHATTFRFRVPRFQDAAVAVWVPGIGRALCRTSCKLMTRTGRRKWRRRNGRFTRPDTRYAHLHDWYQLILFLERWLEAIPNDGLSHA